MISKKVGFLVLILTAVLLSVPLETRAAGADCGPHEFQEVVERACDSIPWWEWKWEWKWNFWTLGWDLVKSSVKSAARTACEGVEVLAQAVTGEVLDPIIGECCRPHDNCYAEGGTSACKDQCDDDFSSCVANKVEWWMWLVNPVAAGAVNWGAPWTADHIGGDLFDGFNLNNDSTCGLVPNWDEFNAMGLYNAVWRPGTTDEIQVYGWGYVDYREKYDELWSQGWRLYLLVPPPR